MEIASVSILFLLEGASNPFNSTKEFMPCLVSILFLLEGASNPVFCLKTLNTNDLALALTTEYLMLKHKKCP